MQYPRYLIVFFLLFFNMTCSYANNKSIILTSETIKSLEHCSVKPAVKLSCKSYRQTTSYTCGPAAVMVLMNYYGLLSSSEMNQKTELRIANEMGTEKDGTSSSQIVAWLEKHGLSVESGRGVTTDMIINNLHKNIPTLIQYSDHWILAKGYSKGRVREEDEIIFSDSCCSVTTISRKNIDSGWGDSQLLNCRKSAGIYIVAFRK